MIHARVCVFIAWCLLYCISTVLCKRSLHVSLIPLFKVPCVHSAAAEGWRDHLWTGGWRRLLQIRVGTCPSASLIHIHQHHSSLPQSSRGNANKFKIEFHWNPFVQTQRIIDLAGTVPEPETTPEQMFPSRTQWRWSMAMNSFIPVVCSRFNIPWIQKGNFKPWTSLYYIGSVIVIFKTLQWERTTHSLPHFKNYFTFLLSS